MHRSGTSAVTRALHALGLSLARGDDLMGATESNPAGHFESWSLTALNDELLLALGGTWSAPPELSTGWEEDAAAAPLVGPAEDTFHAAHPSAPWVWKDPRTSLTLPFWRRVLGGSPAVVVFRHPAEVARSLEARDRLDPALGVALWSRYLRAALAAVAGLPVLLSNWDRLRDDPARWVGTAASWLGALGLHGGGAPDAAAAVEGALTAIRLSEAERADAWFVGPDDHALFEVCLSLEGPHEGLPAAELPGESEDHRRLIAERRRRELRALLAGAGAEGEEVRGYVTRLEAELRRQGEAHAETAAYVRHLQEELAKRRAAHEEVGSYVRHLEEEIRRKDVYIGELSRLAIQAQSSKNRS